jgi:hypothetical protein
MAGPAAQGVRIDWTQVPAEVRPASGPETKPAAGLLRCQFLAEVTAAYPSAASLTDWLPPRLVAASTQRTRAHQAMLNPGG